MTGLGEYLRKEREQKNLSIEDVAKITNLSPKLLQAMEKGDFSDIPGIFYAKNFLKTFLDAVDADKAAFFETYHVEIDRLLEEKRDDPVRYYSKLRYSSFKRKNLFLTVALILALIVSIFCFFYKSKDSLFQVVDVNGTSEKAPISITPSDSFVDANLLAGAVPKDMSYDYSAINVRIEFMEKCWINVNRGGKKVVSGVFQAGETREFHGYNLNLTLGNPSGLRLFVNGSEVTRFKNLNRSIRIQLDPSRLEGLLNNDKNYI